MSPTTEWIAYTFLLVFVLICIQEQVTAKKADTRIQCLAFDNKHPIKRNILIRLLTPKRENNKITKSNERTNWSHEFNYKTLQHILKHEINKNDRGYDKEIKWKPYKPHRLRARKSNTDLDATMDSVMNKFSSSIKKLKKIKSSLNTRTKNVIDQYIDDAQNVKKKSDDELIDEASKNLKDALQTLKSRSIDFSRSDLKSNLAQRTSPHLQSQNTEATITTNHPWEWPLTPISPIPTFQLQNLEVTNSPSVMNPVDDSLKKSQYESILSDKVKELIQLAKVLRYGEN